MAQVTGKPHASMFTNSVSSQGHAKTLDRFDTSSGFHYTQLHVTFLSKEAGKSGNPSASVLELEFFSFRKFAES